MFCTNCGSQVNDGSKFCPNCGEKITVQYQQPQYAAPKAPVKRSNGPAVAGLVFGLLTLILFVIAAFACSGALDMAYRYNYYYSGVSMGTMAFIGGACYGLGCILFIFNLIFGIIGFVRGLKTKSKMAAGIIGFVLIFINLGLLIWEAYAYIAFLVAIM